MKRKILSFLLILTLIFSAMPFTGIDFGELKASASATIPDHLKPQPTVYVWNDYEYIVINGNEVEIITYLGNDTEIIIPSEIDGKAVTSIGNSCFNGYHAPGGVTHPNAENNKKIKSVVVPSTIETINESAFFYDKSLESVTLNEGLEFIDEFAFADCPKLTKIDLPDSLEEFEPNAYDNSAVEEVVLGSNISSLYFDDIWSSPIKRITMNAEINHIYSLQDDSQICLEEIICNGKLYVSDSYKSGGTVKRIIANNGVSFESFDRLSTRGFKPYFNIDGCVLFSSETIEMPEEIESNGFRYYLDYNSNVVISRYIGGESVVVIPETLDGHTVTSIGPLAFAALEKLDSHITETQLISVTLPETITNISDFAFSYNTSLENINIPDSVTVIPQGCFYSCSSLKNIDIPESIKEIEVSAFEWCNALTGIEFHRVEKIGDNAFYQCESLVNVKFSNSLIEIGEEAFLRCPLTETIDLSSVTKIGSDAFFDCNNLKKVVLSDELKHLEYGTFQHCSNLEEVNFPSKLISVGSSCFRLTKIKEAVFGDNLKTIGGLAFGSCVSLETIVLPESIESIGCHAFSYASIETLTIPKNLKLLGITAFGNCKNLTTLYFNATNCKVNNYGNITDIENIETSSPFRGCNITKIYFGSNITSISSNSETYGTFENCETLETVTIPDTVNEIGTAAFKNCTNLETAVIPESVTEIADDAFEGCDKLVIYCSDNSYACAYATAKGITVSTFIIEKIPNQVYTGNQIKPAISVSLSNGKLEINKDFTVAYSNNINAGKAKVTVTGLGDYSMFESTASFTIVTKNISKAKVAEIKDQKYTGEAIKPALTVTDNGRYLKEGKDYKVYFYNNTSKGTAYVSIAGMGNYSGSLKTSFEITELDAGEVFTNWFLGFFTDFFAKFVSIFLNAGIRR